MSVCIFAPVSRYLQRLEEDIGFPGAEVIGSCELSSTAAGNLVRVFLIEENQVLLTAEPSLQPSNRLIFNLLQVIHSLYK